MNGSWIDDTHALLNTSADSAGPTRRLALQSAIGLGYVAAAAPLMAQTAIQTPGKGLVEGEVMIDVDGFKMPAYRAQPAGKLFLRSSSSRSVTACLAFSTAAFCASISAVRLLMSARLYCSRRATLGSE